MSSSPRRMPTKKQVLRRLRADDWRQLESREAQSSQRINKRAMGFAVTVIRRHTCLTGARCCIDCWRVTIIYWHLRISEHGDTTLVRQVWFWQMTGQMPHPRLERADRITVDALHSASKPSATKKKKTLAPPTASHCRCTMGKRIRQHALAPNDTLSDAASVVAIMLHTGEPSPSHHSLALV
jgi:hypothetical protein